MLYDKKNPDNREFRGVDGEGGNVPEPGALFGTRHQYLSLRVGPNLLETGQPLSWLDCFSFLADQPANYIYVAYFFDYDVTMMIRTLPEKVARKLFNRASRTDLKTRQTYPVTYEGFDFDYLPHKEFKIRRHGSKKWVVINDVGTFFQSTFLTTITKWDIGTEEERQFIEWGKAKRASFGAHDAETEAYNALEVLHLEQLMTNFRVTCWETHYVPNKWQGPGHLATAMLKHHGIPRRDEIPILTDGKFRSLAQAAYYGGRFETTAAGPIPNIVYQYDINGAYVYLLKSLPCLTHGTWRWVHDRPADGQLWFGQIHFDHPASGQPGDLPDPFPRLYNLPVRRKDDSIYYPKEANGVYWSTELTAAERAGTTIEFRSGWVYSSSCECRWFDFVDSYYRQRLALGKTTKGYVLKLAGNSIYGKLAQSIGYAPYANPVWAGLITAGCRAMLIDAYSQAPNDCYMLATDGLFMGKKLDLPISKKLGEWEETVHPDGIFIVQPGIYFMGNDVKTRGIERGTVKDVARQHFAEAFERFKVWGLDYTVPVPVTNFTTARVALARNKWETAGTWTEVEREISFNWRLKRDEDVCDVIDEVIRTRPYAGAPDLESVSYGRIIGGELVLTDEAERFTTEGFKATQFDAEQPDWVQDPFPELQVK